MGRIGGRRVSERVEGRWAGKHMVVSIVGGHHDELDGQTRRAKMRIPMRDESPQMTGLIVEVDSKKYARCPYIRVSQTELACLHS